MALPTRGRPTSVSGRGRQKVCCYGTCKSSSSPTLAEDNVEFIRFPKPCLSYRNALPGSAFRRYHKISECKECDRAARWVHRCRRALGLVAIDNIGVHTYICTKHFSSIESAKSLQEDPHPATSGPMKKKRPPPKQRMTTLPYQKIKKENNPAEESTCVMPLSNSSLIDHQDYCLPSDKTENCEEASKEMSDTIDTNDEGEHLPNEYRIKQSNVDNSSTVDQVSDTEIDHADICELVVCRPEINWLNLGTSFLKDGWIVELSKNKLILSRRCDRFILMTISITDSQLEVSVFGKIINLPFYLTSMTLTEENIKLVVSIVSNYKLCEGVSQPDLIDVQKECNDTKGFYCVHTNLCRSYDCSGFLIDEDSSVCSACQDYYDALTSVLNRLNRNELRRTISKGILGRQEQEMVQKKKKNC